MRDQAHTITGHLDRFGSQGPWKSGTWQYTRYLEAHMQNWMWLVVGLTSGGLVVGILIILMAIAANRST
jgi:hypothetical protein